LLKLRAEEGQRSFLAIAIDAHRMHTGGNTVAKIQQEPILEDLLNEPIVHLVMKADGVNAADLRRLLEEMKQRLNRSDLCLAA